MAVVYIRDVSPGVVETLKKRAAASGQSLSAYLNGQLTMMASRPSNAEVVARLRDRERAGGVTATRIADEVREARG